MSTDTRTKPKRSEKRQRPALIATRLTQAELEQVQAAAAAEGISVAELTRRRVLTPA